MTVTAEKAANDFARYLVRRQDWDIWILKTHLPLGLKFEGQFNRDERKFLNRILPRLSP